MKVEDLLPAHSSLSDIVIRASAGTGKTYQLASRFLQLLDADVPPESILAATFTRKAAGEILERILLTLARAAIDDGERTKLASAIGSPQLTSERCRELLAKMTRRLHRLQVGTLDSFFAKLASSFSLELGLPPGWRILETIEAKRLREEAVEALLEAETDDELVRLLRLLTKGTTSRTVSDLIDDTVQNCGEVAVETTPEAWLKVPRPPLPDYAELQRSRQQLQALLDDTTRTDKRVQDAITKDLDSAERDQWEELLKRGILKNLLAGERKYYRKDLDPQTLAVYETMLDQVRRLALHRLSTQTEGTRELLDKFDREFRELQRRQGGCSFSDVARALADWSDLSGETDRSTGSLAMRLDSRLSHLLLDEFQDTSPLQWSVLRPFAEQVARKQRPAQKKIFGENELPPSFFCVGDVKQAIYGWRGGDARIFDTLLRQLPNLTPETLAKSWRSAQPIIDAVNCVFQNLPRHPNLERLAAPIQSWCDAFPEHTTAWTELPGYVEFRSVAVKGEGESQSDVTLQAAANLVADLATKHPTRSIGVLTRSNEAVAKLIFELHHLDVPASEEGGHPLTDSVAVRLLLSLLLLADHPGDRIARFHVATSPLGPAFQFGDFQDDAAAAQLAESLRRRLLCDGYGLCLAAWSKLLADHGSSRDRVRLDQLVKLADGYQPTATLRPSDFVEFVREERVADPSGDRIRVMTVHQAKGLQFDIVVLPELDKLIPGQTPSLVAGNADPAEPPDAVCLYRDSTVQQLLPPELQSLFEQDTERRTHESLCVLYVALTRAIHAMYLLIAPHEKEPTKSFAGLLRASLADNAPAPPEMLLFETGDAGWDIGMTDKSTVAPDPSLARRASVPAQIRFAPPLPTPTRGWQRQAPSNHESQPSRRLGELLRTRPVYAFERGTLIHKWFEQIEWLDTGRPANAQLLAAARTLPPMTLDPEKLLPEFFAMLEQPAITVALRRDTSAHRELTPQVLREHPFACRFERTLISGIIDRLELWSSGDRIVAAEIVDFKTDVIANRPALDARVAIYRSQLESYRRAVSQLFGLEADRITAKLLFVQAGEVVEV
ncbi:DNA helicase [Planctomycetia bacterium]|nr:DNA helicase [Planctomycetia bacterium]